METRNDESKKVPETRKEEKKRRFRIVELEERIAPKYHYNPKAGKYVGHYNYCKENPRFC
jgi:hypothetical protein